MTIQSLIQDYTAFNVWANTQTVEWLKTKPQELMEREIPSSFPNIRLTLLHTWGAEKIWLERLQQIFPTTTLPLQFEGAMEDLYTVMLATSVAFHDYVKALSDEKLQEICDFRLMNGTEDRRTRAHMIQHCMNHSTYHRGQIVTIGRNLGWIDPPSTDFIKYLRLV